MMGMLSFMDPPRPDAKETIKRAVKRRFPGIKVAPGDKAKHEPHQAIGEH